MSVEEWAAAALSPPRAYGPAVGRGRLRVEPEDFVVDEELGFEPAGQGQHVLLRVRKRNANTEWVARALARIAGCRIGDVGYAGMKDRRAVTTQWFSVPRGVELDRWRETRADDFEVLEAHAHTRKLPRGALAGNRFTIRIRDLAVNEASLRERLTLIGSHGVPNYFGAQRFGRDGGNLEAIQRDPRTWHPRERSILLSSARSLIFNAALSERVRDSSWCRLEVGDLANLEGSGSVFAVEALTPDIVERAERLDLHPTGPMWGRGEPATKGRIHELEMRVASNLTVPCQLTVDAGMRQERRSLRVAVWDLAWEMQESTLVLRFRLGRGSFATTVLREIVDVEAEEGGEPQD